MQIIVLVLELTKQQKGMKKKRRTTNKNEHAARVRGYHFKAGTCTKIAGEKTYLKMLNSHIQKGQMAMQMIFYGIARVSYWSIESRFNA